MMASNCVASSPAADQPAQRGEIRDKQEYWAEDETGNRHLVQLGCRCPFQSHDS